MASNAAFDRTQAPEPARAVLSDRRVGAAALSDRRKGAAALSDRRVWRDLRTCYAVMNGNPRPDDAAPTHWTRWSDLYEALPWGERVYLVLRSEPDKPLAAATLAHLNALAERVLVAYGPSRAFSKILGGKVSRINQLTTYDEAWCCAYCQASWIFVNNLTAAPRDCSYWNWKMYDVLHEIAHALSGDWQHTAAFFEEWARLLRAGSAAGVYADRGMPGLPFPDDPGQYSAWNPYTDAGLAEALRLVAKHRGHPVIGP